MGWGGAGCLLRNTCFVVVVVEGLGFRDFDLRVQLEELALSVRHEVGGNSTVSRRLFGDYIYF